jgi:L-alanine-DL-glutamate epimerase-like enolase superfamily enzyme
MQIEAVELRRIQIPFRRAFGHAAHERTGSDAILVAVVDDAGTVGWGEILPRPYVTAETIDGVLEDTAPVVAGRLLGHAFERRDDVVAWLVEAADVAGRALATACGFDLALLDCAGRRLGFSAADVLGGVRGPSLPAGVIIGFEIATEQIARYCATLRLAGRRHIKLKVGRDDDDERLRAVARVFKDTPIRLDANAAWTAQQTIARLRGWAELSIASIEQPVPADDVEGLRAIREQTDVAVMADESVCTLGDAERLVAEGAADIFNVRLGKNGGLVASQRLVQRAAQLGIAVHLGTMVGETGVLSRASEVFGRCVPGFDCLDGKGQNAFLLEQDILEPHDDSSDPDHDPPGLGVRISDARVQAHQVGEPRRFSRA